MKRQARITYEAYEEGPNATGIETQNRELALAQARRKGYKELLVRYYKAHGSRLPYNVEFEPVEDEPKPTAKKENPCKEENPLI